MFKNKTLLITGGTGSFGKAMLNRYLNTDLFSEIRIFPLEKDQKPAPPEGTLWVRSKIYSYN